MRAVEFQEYGGPEVLKAVTADMFRRSYADVFRGDERWQSLPTAEGSRFAWDPNSTYVRKPTFLEGMTMEAVPPRDIVGVQPGRAGCLQGRPLLLLC